MQWSSKGFIHYWGMLSDFEGDSLAMLAKIATALNQELEVRFVPASAADTAELLS
jgi:hypothetical protein